MPWKVRPDVRRLREENHTLAMKLFEAKRKLQAAEHHRVGLEVALNVRGERIDQLVVRVAQLQQENRKLDLEAEHLAALFRETEATPVTKEDAN